MIAAADFPDLRGEGVLGEGLLDPRVLGPRASGAGLPSEGVLGVGVMGVGTDLVDIAQFASQLETAGSTFGVPGVFFTSRELRRARERALEKGDSPAEHLAAVWAVKEAAIKAWVSALESEGAPLPLSPEQVKWAQITVTHSASGAPRLQLVGEMAEVFNGHFGAGNADSADARSARGPHEGHGKPDARGARGPRGAVDTDGTPPPSTPTWYVSASHDGAYAVGFVVLAR